MRKCDELSDPNSCLNRAGDEEQVFVLRASDPAAAVAVRAWCVERCQSGRNLWIDPKIVSALRWAEDAEASQR